MTWFKYGIICDDRDKVCVFCSYQVEEDIDHSFSFRTSNIIYNIWQMCVGCVGFYVHIYFHVGLNYRSVGPLITLDPFCSIWSILRGNIKRKFINPSTIFRVRAVFRALFWSFWNQNEAQKLIALLLKW